MTYNNLSKILNEMYFSANKGEKVTMIHLFGVKFSNEIESSGLTASEIVKGSNLSDKYITEVRKGMNLAKYVSVL